MSSAYVNILQDGELRSGMLFRKMLKSSGPSTEPCGTPMEFIRCSETSAPILTNWCLPVK